MSNLPAKTDMVGMIERLAADPSFDVTKFEALVRLYHEMERDQAANAARAAYNAAMSEVQREVEPVVRTTQNDVTHSWYAKLEDIDQAIRESYLAHGFSLSFDSVEPLQPGNIRMRCRCRHSGGHQEDYHREAAPDTLGPRGSATKTALHGAASTETFLKRYLICGIFNVVFLGQDNDGTGVRRKREIWPQAAAQQQEPPDLSGLLATGDLAARHGTERLRQWWTQQITKEHRRQLSGYLPAWQGVAKSVDTQLGAGLLGDDAAVNSSEPSSEPPPEAAQGVS